MIIISLTALEEPVHVTRPLLPDIEKVSNRMKEIWESRWITNNGDQHKQLEKELTKHLRAKNISIFSNGTLALILGLKALEVKGEVITTPFTFPATLQAVDWNGLTPVFCDIEKETLNIDANQIESLITNKTSAILAVHVFGNPCDVKKIQTIADKYNLRVIYDGAHAFGTQIKWRSVSSFGDMTMFSFHATKLFNTVEGGALVYNNENLKEKLESLKNFGLRGSEEVILSGMNAKLNEIQAAIGLEVLKLVENERKRREEIKKVYEENLKSIDGIRIITTLEGENNSFQYFVIEIDEEKYGMSRDYLHEELKKYNIFTRRYFNPLCSEFSWYRDLESAKYQNLKQAHKSVKNVLSMPFYGDLQLETVKKICRIIREIPVRLSRIK